MPGPFGRPLAPDLSLDLASGYQQDAAAKISQARVKTRKDYTGAYAGKYGVQDAAAATKGLSDVDIYKMANDLVTKRRGKTATPTPPGAKPPAQKPAQKPAAKRRSAPVVKSPAKRGLANAPIRKKTTTTRKKKAVARKPISAKEAAGVRKITTAIQQAKAAASSSRGYDY